MKPGPSAVLLLSLLAAGCTEAAEPPAPEAEPKRLRLADLAECRFTYPDGRAIPCEDQARPVEARVLGPGWLCTDNAASSKVKIRIYRHAVKDEVALAIEAADRAPVSGVARAGATIYAWQDAPASALLVLPGLPPEDTVSVEAFRLVVDAEPPALAAAKPRVLWSLYEEQAYPLHRLDTAQGASFVHAVVTVDFGGGPLYAQAPVDLVGEDFRLFLRPETVGNAVLSLSPRASAAC